MRVSVRVCVFSFVCVNESACVFAEALSVVAWQDGECEFALYRRPRPELV